MIPVHLFFHVVVQSVTAKASGCRVCRVACEHCGCAYIYQLRRTATGAAQSYMFFGRRNKKQAAEIAAQGQLEKPLAEEVDAVPCPECGKLQADMIRRVRRMTLWGVSLISAFLGIVVAFTWACTNQWMIGARRVPAAWLATWIWGGWLCGSLAWALLGNFNARAHRQTRAALGAHCRAMPAEEFEALIAGEDGESTRR